MMTNFLTPPHSGKMLTAVEAQESSSLYHCSLAAIFLLSAFNVAALRFLSAPYGKFSRPGWGPLLPAPLAWSLMESPALLLPPLLSSLYNYPLLSLPLSLFLLHYLHRTLVYPLRLLLLSPKPSPVPFSIALCAFSFNVLNAYLQTAAVARPQGPLGFAWSAMGAVVFFWGMSVNLQSDAALLRLKAEGRGYRVPRGGWFEAVCCPNYMGEVAEWLGWALLARTPAAFGFFVYTWSNLVPRARDSRDWYRSKFGEEFPESRKAIIPYIY